MIGVERGHFTTVRFLAECLALLKLSGSAMGHLMTFIEVGMHPTLRSTKRNETQRKSNASQLYAVSDTDMAVLYIIGYIWICELDVLGNLRWKINFGWTVETLAF